MPIINEVSLILYSKLNNDSFLYIGRIYEQYKSLYCSRFELSAVVGRGGARRRCAKLCSAPRARRNKADAVRFGSPAR